MTSSQIGQHKILPAMQDFLPTDLFLGGYIILKVYQGILTTTKNFPLVVGRGIT
jgi:hypothetical protein